MSASTREDALLQARAARLAQRQAQDAPRRVFRQTLVVKAGHQRYALPVSHLRQVIPAPPISPLPGLPPFILGIASVRGELVSVIDLAELLLRGKTGEHGLLVLACGKPGTIGLRVETMEGFRDIFRDEIATGLSRQAAEDRAIEAVTRDLVSVLDLEALLASERVAVARKGGSIARGARR